jgi:uncharacterized protein YbjQ (UPF0145 family)
MILTTGATVEGHHVKRYLDVVSAHALLGVHTDSPGACQQELARAVRQTKDELWSSARSLGADAVIAVALDYEEVGDDLLMVAASGTAVKLG